MPPPTWREVRAFLDHPGINELQGQQLEAAQHCHPRQALHAQPAVRECTHRPPPPLRGRAVLLHRCLEAMRALHAVPAWEGVSPVGHMAMSALQQRRRQASSDSSQAARLTPQTLAALPTFPARPPAGPAPGAPPANPLLRQGGWGAVQQSQWGAHEPVGWARGDRWRRHRHLGACATVGAARRAHTCLCHQGEPLDRRAPLHAPPVHGGVVLNPAAGEI